MVMLSPMKMNINAVNDEGINNTFGMRNELTIRAAPQPTNPLANFLGLNFMFLIYHNYYNCQPLIICFVHRAVNRQIRNLVVLW